MASTGISVSGFSSGACMAILHFARSPRNVDGLGYDACNAGFLLQRLGAEDRKALKGKPVYVMVGKYDKRVKPSGVKSGAKILGEIVGDDKIQTDYDQPVGHSWLSRLYGKKMETCSKKAPMQNCNNHDLGGKILKHIYPALTKPQWAAPGPTGLYWLSQKAYTGAKTPARIGAANWAGVYIPGKCHAAPSTCKLHVHYHGCNMGVTTWVKANIIKYGGFNDWALANDIIVLYPQVRKCWSFMNTKATNPQLMMVQGMIRDLQARTAQLNNMK